ncbi:MAG: hypothetical protein QF473_00095 [Planctomycetota bacterium]|nr:hypothetical protein [Planctomycetota bacterium]
MSKHRKKKTIPRHQKPGSRHEPAAIGPADQLQGLSGKGFTYLSAGCFLLALGLRWLPVTEVALSSDVLYFKAIIFGVFLCLCANLSCTTAHIYCVLRLKTAPRYMAAIWGGWWLVCFKAIIEWPLAVFPIINSLHTWYGFLAVFGLPVIFLATKRGSWPKGQDYCGPFIKILLSVGIVATLSYLKQVYIEVEGIDFWYYLCNSRDIVLSDVEAPIARHIYFPGVYTFWRIILRLFGGTLFSIQVAYVVLQLFNIVAVGLLTGLVTRRVWLAVWSSLAFAVLCSRYEGFEGQTEPLATLPILIGLILWRGRPLRLPVSYISLGFAFGLTVYFRQQGALLAMAYASIVFSEWLRGHREKQDWLAALGIPVISVCCFLLLVLLEGMGLQPITFGIRQANQYARESSWWENISSFREWNWTVGVSILCLIAGYLAILSREKTRQWLKEPAGCLFGYALWAVLLSLLQFSWRHYQHYFLLGAPFLALSLALLGHYVWTNLPPEATSFPVTRLLAITLAGAVTAVPGHLPGSLHLWSFKKYPGHPPWLSFPENLQSLQSLAPHVKRREAAVLLPLGRNEVHFMLGTLSKLKVGYGWPHELDDADWDETDVVVVFKQGRHLKDRWKEMDCETAFNGMLAAGFEPEVETEVMTLYRKPGN